MRLPAPLSAIFLLLIAVLCLQIMVPAAMAHPADELCGPGSQLDPKLCKALSEADAKPTKQKVSVPRTLAETVRTYLWFGYTHILPKGLDHILFVLALFFASKKMRPLLIQISAFTIAHTLTLALATLGKVSAPPDIVEPLIAASIAWVAIENLIFGHMTRWRPLIVFGFGLFHGLGFASVLGDLGLEQGQFLASLISFNVGVELGQLSIVAGAWMLFHWFYDSKWYDRTIPVIGSLGIACMGIIWAVERIFFAG